MKKKELSGTVSDGTGNAGENLSEIKSLIAKRVGLRELVNRSLKVVFFIFLGELTPA